MLNCYRMRVFSYTSVPQVVTVVCLPLTRMGCAFSVLTHFWDLPSWVLPCAAVWGSRCRASHMKKIPWIQKPAVFWVSFMEPSTSSNPLNARECARGSLGNSILAVFSKWQFSGALYVSPALLTEAKVCFPLTRISESKISLLAQIGTGCLTQSHQWSCLDCLCRKEIVSFYVTFYLKTNWQSF